MSKELSTTDQLPAKTPLSEVMIIAKSFADSGLFTDIKQASQAVVKILAGQEMGIPPFAAMTGIHVIQGKPTVGAGLMASRVKGGGKYDYKVVEHTDKICSLDFYKGKEKLGNSTFTLDDAKKAQTKNLDKFPKNMLFARALSNGVKFFTPDIYDTVVYVPEEMDQVTVDVTHTVVDTPPATNGAKKKTLTDKAFGQLIEKVKKTTTVQEIEEIQKNVAEYQLTDDQATLFVNECAQQTSTYA